MLDSNEKVQSQIDNYQASGANIEANDDASEIKKKELNKRALVEQEIKKHPLFLNMQKVTRNAHINIMVDTVVDAYFNLSTTSNVLNNKEYYRLDDSTILMALEQIAYLISVEENGVVLDEYGELDEEASLEQQEAAIYSEALKSELRDEEKKDIYIELLEKMDKKDVRRADTFLNSYSHEDFSKSHDILIDLINYNEKAPLMKEEWKQVSRKINEDTELKKSQVLTKDKLFFNTKDDFMITRYALSYFSELYKKEPDPEKLADFINKVKDIDKENRFNDLDIDEFSAEKMVEYAKDYHSEYIKRANYKELVEFCESNTDFDTMDVKSQQTILTSIYSLYKMPPCPERNWALIAMGSISPGTVKVVGETEILNEEKFLNLYNATNKVNKTFEEMEYDVSRKDFKKTLAYMQSINKKIKQGNFKDLEIPENVTPEEAQKIEEEFRNEIRQKEKPHFHQDSHDKLEREIDKIIKDNNLQGNRNELVIATYKYLNTKGKIYNSSEYEVSSQYIREHVEGYASIYGSYLEDGKITTRKLLVDNYEVEKIATGIMQFRKKELDIEERKFSFASVKENAKAVASFVKRSAKYAGDQTKKFFDSIMHKNLLALPSGEQTQENKRGIWDFLRRDPNLVNREEIMTMSEQFSEDDQLKKAKQKAEKNTKKINKLDIKVTNEEEQSYNDIFKRGITSETLKNIDDASKKAKENLNNIQKGSVQVSKEQSRVILGGEIEFE